MLRASCLIIARTWSAPSSSVITTLVKQTSFQEILYTHFSSQHRHTTYFLPTRITTIWAAPTSPSLKEQRRTCRSLVLALAVNIERRNFTPHFSLNLCHLICLGLHLIKNWTYFHLSLVHQNLLKYIIDNCSPTMNYMKLSFIHRGYLTNIHMPGEGIPIHEYENRLEYGKNIWPFVHRTSISAKMVSRLF